jgi:hypothetical protein
MSGLRALIRRMSIENRLWGAPRIHGELLKLGFAVAQSTVAKYMASTDGRPCGQRWGTFLRNHLPQIAAVDLFVVPCHYRKFYPLRIRAMRENQSIIRRDACHPPSAWNVCRQPVQVAAPA